MTWINGLETTSGCISDSATGQTTIGRFLLRLPTLIAYQKHPAAMFGDTQSVVLHAG
jgi:hypothetical protein